MIVLKNKEEIEKIRSSCSIVVDVLMRLSEKVEPGISTYELDKIAEDMAKKMVQGLLLRVIETILDLFALL